MLTAMAPLLNPAVVVLVSLGIMVSTCITLRMGILCSPRLFCIKEMYTSVHFCTRLQQCYNGSVAVAFSSAFSIPPSHIDTVALVSDGEDSNKEDHAAPEDEVDWYTPPPLPLAQPSPPPPSLHAISPPSNTFELGMCLSFHDSAGQAETVVYKGAMPDGFTHTVWQQDGTRLNVHDPHLCLKMQANLSNILRTPLDYCKEVGKCITKEEAKNLARSRILTPLQQELMDWHHCLYHLSFPKIFCLAKKNYLPKSLLKCKGALPLCIACQVGTSHWHPWCTQGKATGSIRCHEHILPGGGVLVNQIVSAQPGLIPQMSGFLTSCSIWGCTTFCDDVSDFVYVHLM
jgi:hypothetical protein